MNTRKVANGLGWFSIALGVTEILAARSLAKSLGMKGALGMSGPTLLRVFGVREIVAGIGLLTQAKKGPWIWARIAGDALDAAALGAAMTGPKRGNAALALGAVSPVVALDVVCGQRLGLSA